MTHFIKIGPAGGHLPADAKAWDAVLDTRTGLMWTEKSHKVKDYAAALKVPAKLAAAGFTDWRLPTIRELLSLVEYERSKPAIDTGAFECESAWYWTATPYAPAPADCVWLVGFDYGSAFHGFRDRNGFVRAVRGGQESGL